MFLRLSFTLFALLSAIYVEAYDFMVDGLAYNFNSDGASVTVTYERPYRWNSSTYRPDPTYPYLYEANIPDSVVYNDKKYVVDSIGNMAFYGCIIEKATIPNTIKAIGVHAFVMCQSLTEINIPSSLDSSSEFPSFNYCSKLKKIYIPHSLQLKSLGSVFNRCESLESISLPPSVEKIDGTFVDCLSLEWVDLPKNLKEIGNNSFAHCWSLSFVSLPNTLESIGDGAFDNSGLQSVIIPNSVNHIGQNAFQNCSKLSSVCLGESVHSIEYGCFYNYINKDNIVSLTICGDVVDIADNAIAYSNEGNNIKPLTIPLVYIKEGVNELSSWKMSPNHVYCFSQTPPECDATTFMSYSGTLHVPARAIAAYFNAPHWCNFANIVGDAVTPDEITIDIDNQRLNVDESKEIETSVYPNLPNPVVTFISSNSAIGYISGNRVTAILPGEFDIIATFMDLIDSCHVKVSLIDIHDMELETGTMAMITPVSMPVITNVVAKSDDPYTVATRFVNGQIQVLAVKPGTATITVEALVDDVPVADTCNVFIPRHPGDTNADGYIDIDDVNRIINVILEQTPSPENEELSFYDLDSGGRVDIDDLNAVINLLLAQ